MSLIPLFSQTLQDRVDSLLSILASSTNSSAQATANNAFVGLKGLWKKLLISSLEGKSVLPALKGGTESGADGDKDRFDEHCAAALALLTAQCVQEVRAEYGPRAGDTTSSFIFLRLLDKVFGSCVKLLPCCS